MRPRILEQVIAGGMAGGAMTDGCEYQPSPSLYGPYGVLRIECSGLGCDDQWLLSAVKPQRSLISHALDNCYG